MAFVGADGVVVDQTSGSSTTNVFVSFRGPDIPKHLIDILFNDLIESGFKVFKYNEKLVHEKEILTSLYQAIELSQLYIVILSPTFAESRWCLDELAKIFECIDLQGRTVLPVFYRVEPTNVQHPNEEALKELGKKFGHECRVNAWKEALEKISRRVGLSLSDTNWREELLEERIIEVAKRIFGPRQEMVPTLPNQHLPTGVIC